jgi:eukaryotic-like serine/threonine-protein kinase
MPRTAPVRIPLAALPHRRVGQIMIGHQFHSTGKALLAIALSAGVAACGGSGTTVPPPHRPYTRVTVPYVSLYTVPIAVHKIRAKGLRHTTKKLEPNLLIPSGLVIATVPAAGSRVRINSTVKLLVSEGVVICTGCKEVTRVMPDVCGLTFQQANTLLAESGITLNPQAIRQASPEPPGTVIQSVPAAGTLFIAYGSPAAEAVVVTISSGQTTSPAQTASAGSQNTCSPPPPSPSSP